MTKADPHSIFYRSWPPGAGQYGFGPVAYFEEHGTGTEIGDIVELTALTETIREEVMNNALAVAGPSPLGRDVEPVIERPPAIWQHLLGNQRHQVTKAVRRETGEREASAATRVWAISKCMTKVVVNSNVPVVLERIDREHWIVFSCGCFRVATTIVSVSGCDHPLVRAVLVGSDHASV